MSKETWKIALTVIKYLVTLALGFLSGQQVDNLF
jgi:hypothetical protein